MTGVKGYIRENLPKTWEIILLRNKCLGSFIEQFYQAIAKPKNRNKYYYKITIMNARHYMKCYSINSIAVGFNFKEGADFWNNISNQVSNYEFNCN